MVLCMGSHRSAGQQKKAAAFLRIFICISLMSFMAIPAQAATPQVSAGSYHTLALRSDGTVWAWGDNTYDQLGQGTSSTLENSTKPVAVTGLTGTFTAVAAGDEHSLALKSDGTVWAWGYNTYGQLGDTVLDTNTGAPIAFTEVPVKVTNLTNIKAIAAGTGFSMALDTSGNVWTWGRNDSGQLGNGTAYTYTNTQNGQLVPTSGQLTVEVTPTKITTLSNITGIAAGEHHALAVDSTNAVWAWGLDNCGQLGDNIPSSTGSSCIFATTPVIATPQLVPAMSGVSSVAAGSYHSLAIKSDNSVEAWGANAAGQLGIGTSSDSSLPEALSGLTGVTALGGGSGHSAALGGTAVSTWGVNTLGQLGNGNTTSSDVPISSVLTGAAGVTAGEFFTVAWKSDGTVWAWGDNSDGQLGNGTSVAFGTASPTPTQVASFSLTTLLGDWNNDGQVSAVDALLCLQYAVGINTLNLTSVVALERGDMNGDKQINATDALLILRKAVGL
ncbi:MAG: dockerin type I domain-containing protein [Oryzomonas sp.]|uniref:RCC1 domain-containing protein n=1 Tax=Oryzomonas sp. TaxID=2855186 RepID=UPI0028400327|nr:dockerin type I domain-containing protein [Oryzomonas sp.]MDR3578342.1 dockerin type I domain-containing protein [Oryzomonas sp.]